MHEGRRRKGGYSIAMSEKVGTERLIHEGTPDGQKTRVLQVSGDFEVNQSAENNNDNIIPTTIFMVLSS